MHGLVVAVVAPPKVAVERRENGVLLVRADVGPFPLPDDDAAPSAGVWVRMGARAARLRTPARARTCPMHGPHAFASTSAPTASSAAAWPSRAIVARICSDPGVTSSCALSGRRAAAAWRAIAAALVMSS